MVVISGLGAIMARESRGSNSRVVKRCWFLRLMKARFDSAMKSVPDGDYLREKQ